MYLRDYALLGNSGHWDLAGKVVVVTGAAKGLGAEMARRLAGEGASVALVGLEGELLRTTAASCGSEASVWDADVRDWRQLQAAYDGILALHGRVDAVIANAGVAPPGFARSMDVSDFERVIEVNLLGVWRTARTFLPALVESRGYLLVVSSLASVVHGPGIAAYSASKAGCEAFADSLRVEVAHLGVGVGVAYFSWIDTDMVAAADRHPVFGRLRTSIPSLGGKVYPVSLVGDAVVHGLRQRADAIMVPGWVLPVRALRGLVVPLVTRYGRRGVAEADREIEASSLPVA